MLLILLSWFVTASIVLAFGSILVSIWNKISKKENLFSFFDIFWIGLSAVSTFTIIISLFFPLNIYILLLFIAIAVGYWIVCYPKLFLLCRSALTFFRSLSVWTKIALFLVFFVICLLSVQPAWLGDYGLYYLQSMMWAENYSVVPGLGNLHGRLGFNSSFLLLTTLFSYHPDYFILVYSLNSLCLLIFSVWLISRIRKDSSLFYIVAVLGIFVSIISVFGVISTSFSTDILAGIAILYALLSVVLDADKNIGDRILPLVVVSMFCITLKLSVLPIILIPLYIFVTLLKRKAYKPLLFLLLFSCMIIIPWCLRFVIQTGYLIYPLASVDIFSFDWKMPAELLIEERNWAYSWARIPNMDSAKVLSMPFKEWVPLWIGNLSYKELFLYSLLLVSPIILCFSFKKLKESFPVLLVWIIAILGSAFVFYTAPAIRFGFGFILSAGFIPLLLLQSKFSYTKYIRIIPFALFLLFVLNFSRKEIFRMQNYFPHVEAWYSVFYKPQSLQFYEDGINPEFSEYKIGNTIIYKVTNSDQCFDQCLPCTPYLNDNLGMRGESLQDGFRIRP